MSRLKFYEVRNRSQFAELCRHELGCDVDYKWLGIFMKNFRKKVPNASYKQAAWLVDWAIQRGKRPRTLKALFALTSDAIASGLYEVNAETEVKEYIADALQIEDDPTWRYRLYNALGFEAERSVFEEWKQYRLQNL